MYYIVNGLDDQTLLLVWSKIKGIGGVFFPLGSFRPYEELFWSVLHPLKTNQPLVSLIVYLFASLGDPNTLIVLTILSVALFFATSYLLFKRFKYGFFYSLLFVFSSYLWVHLGIHIDLLQLWIIPLFFFLNMKEPAKPRHCILIGITISLAVALSSYLGFLVLVYFTLYSFLHALFERSFKDLKKFLFVSVISGALSMVFLFPYVKENYISHEDNFSQSLVTDHNKVVNRPYEDFFHFSSRPWYFFLPPVKNPWLGEISQTLVDRISSTNYFLADDYFGGEDSANYLGLVFLISVTVLSIVMFFKAPLEKRRQIAFYWVLNILIYLFMLPPFFTISGIKIYTPGELMYRLFPMFRVTIRMVPLLLFNFLIILALSVDYLSKKHSLFFKFFIPLLTLVTLLETFVPPKIVYYSKPPEVYTYLGTTVPYSKFAVYPYSQTDEAFFWLDIHKGYLLNVRDYIGENYNSEEFTKKLPTDEGLASFKELGGTYLIVFNSISSKDLLYFTSSSRLRLVNNFPNSMLFYLPAE